MPQPPVRCSGTGPCNSPISRRSGGTQTGHMETRAIQQHSIGCRLRSGPRCSRKRKMRPSTLCPTQSLGTDCRRLPAAPLGTVSRIEQSCPLQSWVQRQHSAFPHLARTAHHAAAPLRATPARTRVPPARPVVQRAAAAVVPPHLPSPPCHPRNRDTLPVELATTPCGARAPTPSCSLARVSMSCGTAARWFSRPKRRRTSCSRE